MTTGLAGWITEKCARIVLDATHERNRETTMNESVKHFDMGDAVARLSGAIEIAFGDCPEEPREIQKLHDLLEKRFAALIREVEQFYR